MAIIALGVPGIVGVGLVFTGQWPASSSADVVDDGSGVFKALSTPAPAPAVPATEVAPTAAPASEAPTGTQQPATIAAAKIAAQGTTASGSSSSTTTSSESSSAATEASSTADVPATAVAPKSDSSVITSPDRAEASNTPSTAAPTPTAPTDSSTNPPVAEKTTTSLSPSATATSTTEPSVPTKTTSTLGLLALAYVWVGAVAAVLASVLHWLLPYLANHPAEGASETIARRVHRIQALARGFGLLEYPLLLIGTANQLSLALTNLGNQVLNLSLLMLYLSLWLFQLLLLMKRSVIGRVVTPRQQPIELSLVRAVDPITHRVKATEATDASGRFRFKLHDGQYELQAESDGYERSITTETVSQQMESRSMLVLKPVAAVTTPPAPPDLLATPEERQQATALPSNRTNVTSLEPIENSTVAPPHEDEPQEPR